MIVVHNWHRAASMPAAPLPPSHSHIIHIYLSLSLWSMWILGTSKTIFRFTCVNRNPIQSSQQLWALHTLCICVSHSQSLAQTVHCSRFIQKINIIINHKTFLMESIFCPEQDVCFVRIHIWLFLWCVSVVCWCTDCNTQQFNSNKCPRACIRCHLN